MTEATWKDPDDKEPIERLWEEYHYRHSHIWRIVYQATLAIVALSVVPYLDAAKSAGYLKVIPLFIAAGLAVFTFLRMKREFVLFNAVKTEYLVRTRQEAKDVPDAKSSDDPEPNAGRLRTTVEGICRWVCEQKFDVHTLLYLGLLAAGSLAHLLILMAALLFPEFHDYLKLNIAPCNQPG